MGKWGQFHQAHSNLVKGQPQFINEFRSVAVDWFRESGSDKMTVNGVCQGSCRV